jgi:methionine-rich copper-binding protein CopC
VLGFGVGLWKNPIYGASVAEPQIRLSGTHTIAENASITDIIGTLSVVNGSGVYAFGIDTGGDPEGKFSIVPAEVYLRVGAGLNFEDDASHPVTIVADNGVDPTFTRTFTITVTNVDEVAPTISSLSPADNATDVAVSANFVMTFNEAIAAGATANFYLTQTSGDVLVETLTEADFGTKLVVSGDTLTINWTSNLDASTAYYVEWDAGSVTDIAGNPLAASTGGTQWNITTAAEGGGGGAPVMQFNDELNNQLLAVLDDF